MTNSKLARREWWIGRTENGFDKWLTTKHPDEQECRNVFICSDASEQCVEYIAVIEKSAYDAALKDAEMLVEALEAACETIHGEFCGFGTHHPLCAGPREALAKWRGKND